MRQQLRPDGGMTVKSLGMKSLGVMTIRGRIAEADGVVSPGHVMVDEVGRHPRSWASWTADNLMVTEARTRPDP